MSGEGKQGRDTKTWYIPRRADCGEVSEGYWVSVVGRWAESGFMVSNMMLVKE